MNLGPSLLNLMHRRVMKGKKNKVLIQKYLSGKIDWDHKDLKEIKDRIRVVLRHEQNNRCIYCRRLIKVDRRNVSEDIEHYLDKSKPYYKKWAFTAVNLTLSCRPCNFVKSTKDLGYLALRNDVNIKNGIGRFRWLHPYFDDYHANIEIRKGWVYLVKDNAPNKDAAIKMIQECELDKVEQVEKVSERIKLREQRLVELSLLALRRKRYDRSEKLLELICAEKNKNWYDY
ncbi:hypothetical protein ACEQ8A_000531 [Vibrio fluvialis]|uniref:hypothetical protein n=1 Tax=Vibrio fluvialis TaxID=676 RepID=UPI000462E319|nr:hypothetical protein [Vibrio fluvialis]ELS3714171.1 hypothetical protein [Vibrio fluvialis]ELX9690872.1 hypothetical protein [Vibrio fluvialis]MBY7812856.1 hypothetical protein [Vibrio fluvialis]MBY8208810.1 hypothetical protein [Vibrio fluvialis]MCG6382571.1 hypothetical protein [Vibrio fluvialis]